MKSLNLSKIRETCRAESKSRQEDGKGQKEHAAGARQEHVEQEGNDGREKTKCLHGNNFNPDMRFVRKVF